MHITLGNRTLYTETSRREGKGLVKMIQIGEFCIDPARMVHDLEPARSLNLRKMIVRKAIVNAKNTIYFCCSSLPPYATPISNATDAHTCKMNRFKKKKKLLMCASQTIEEYGAYEEEDALRKTRMSGWAYIKKANENTLMQAPRSSRRLESRRT
ncbi:hypothetical protein Syun_031304 [Stephania yunnanensis]|uniref:Uncharacterized protein n=1 Tax=Stephania yunnanensis TaxID=152371 RepID=A0AAP0E0D3_9MAGN